MSDAYAERYCPPGRCWVQPHETSGLLGGGVALAPGEEGGVPDVGGGRVSGDVIHLGGLVPGGLWLGLRLDLGLAHRKGFIAEIVC